MIWWFSNVEWFFDDGRWKAAYDTEWYQIVYWACLTTNSFFSEAIGMFCLCLVTDMVQLEANVRPTPLICNLGRVVECDLISASSFTVLIDYWITAYRFSRTVNYWNRWTNYWNLDNDQTKMSFQLVAEPIASWVKVEPDVLGLIDGSYRSFSWYSAVILVSRGLCKLSKSAFFQLQRLIGICREAHIILT